MKKLLGIVVLGLLLSSNAYAESCTKYLEMSWKYLSSNLKHVTKDENPFYAEFKFKSTSDIGIIINEVVLLTEDNRLVKSDEANIWIRPFGKGNALMIDLNKINLDVVDGGTYRCSFSKEKPSTKLLDNQKKSGAKKLLEKIFGN